MISEKYYTLTQAAKDLGISRPTLSKIVHSNTIPHEMFGRTILIARKDLKKVVCPTCGQIIKAKVKTETG